MTASERFAAEGASWVAQNDEAKAVRLGGTSMLIVKGPDFAEAVGRIKRGTTKPIRQIGREMASAAGADIACPRSLTIAWQLVAAAAEEGIANPAPWWRVTIDGKPSPKMPGGIHGHRARIAAELEHPADPSA